MEEKITLQTDTGLRAVDHLLFAYMAVRLRHGAVPCCTEGRARRHDKVEAQSIVIKN